MRVFTGRSGQGSGRVLRRRALVISFCLILVVLFLVDLLTAPTPFSLIGRATVSSSPQLPSGHELTNRRSDLYSSGVASNQSSPSSPVKNAFTTVAEHTKPAKDVVAKTMEDPITSASDPNEPTKNPETLAPVQTKPTKAPVSSATAPTKSLTSASDLTKPVHNAVISAPVQFKALKDPIISTPVLTNIAKDPVTSASDPTKSVVDSVTLASDPTKPVKNAVTSASDPTKSVEDPVTSSSDPTKPVKDPVTSASDPTISVTDQVTSVSDRTKSVKDPVTEVTNPASITNDSSTTTNSVQSQSRTPSTAVRITSLSPILSSTQDLTTAFYELQDLLPEAEQNRSSREDLNETRVGFAVWSPFCQIPDLDPWHPTIRHLVSSSPPLDCSVGHPAISQTGETIDPATGHVRTWIRIDPSLMSNRTDPSCCYQTVFRKNDNNVEYGTPCRTLDPDGESTLLSGEEEFVRVECRAGGEKKPFFTDFHASFPDKQEVRERLRNIPTMPDDSYNLLILGLDAMSRLNAHRQIPRTLDYLMTELGAVEMRGFQKVGDNTFPNLVPVLTGHPEDKLQDHCSGDLKKSLDGCPWLWKDFALAGYRTAYGEDTAWMSTFNYAKAGFAQPPTDYYSRPHMKTLETEVGWNKVMNYNLCLGPRSQAEALLQWTSGFLHAFSTSPYMALTWVNSLSHDHLNSASSGDLLLRDFLRDLKEGGHLNRTVLVLMGDHGIRWGEIVQTYVGRMEERLPMLFLSLPQDLEDRHPEWAENVRYNSHRLCTHFDLHSTFLELLPNVTSNATTLGNGGTGPGLSLFSPLPVDRTCEQAGVDGQWCTCQQSKEVQTTDREVVHVTEFVVDHLNHLLSGSPMCRELKLESVSSARLRSPLDHLKGNVPSKEIFDYSVTFKTSPGGAILDATVRFVPQNHTHELLGEVSRLNLYGEQSWCVRDSKSKKFCYCKEQLQNNAV